MGVPFLKKYLTVRRDSLDELEDERRASHFQQIRRGRFQKRRMGVGGGLTVGVGTDTTGRPITSSKVSGFAWKKKWRDRKARSKEKRRLKHIERKKRRAELMKKNVGTVEQEDDSSDDDSDTDGSDQSSSQATTKP
ncbi:uncharacterized protein LOC143285853 isoform X2 [Babylonia areolata]